MMFDLTGKTALVTGASGGPGGRGRRAGRALFNPDREPV